MQREVHDEILRGFSKEASLRRGRRFLFAIRNAGKIVTGFVNLSWKISSTNEGGADESARLPELRRYRIHCEARRHERKV